MRLPATRRSLAKAVAASKAARHAQRVGGHAHAVFAERFQDEGVGAFHLAQQAVVGHEGVVDMDQRGFRGAYPFLLELGDIEAEAGQFDDEQADRIRSRFALTSARGHQQEVRERRIGDVQLAAVQAPAACDAFGARLHGALIGAAVRLAQTEVCHSCARPGQGAEALLPLRRAAGLPDRPDAQMGVRATRSRRRPGTGSSVRRARCSR